MNPSPPPGSAEFSDIEKYRSYIAFAPDGMLVVDAKGCFVEVNPAACRITGYAEEELLGMHFMDLVAPDGRALGAEHFQKTVSAGEAFDDIPYLHKSGAQRWFTVKAVRIDETHFIAFIHDVTELRQVSEALLVSEERVKFALDATQDGLWDWNLISNQVYFSAQYYRMLGYEPNEFAGNYSEWKARVHPEDFLKITPVISQTIKDGSQFDFEFRMKQKSGEWLWIRARGRVMVHDQDGNPLRMVGTHTNISGRKAIEEDLQSSRARLLRAERVAKSGNWEFHFKSGLLYSSEGAMEIYGTAQAEMPIKEVQQYPLPEYRAYLDEALRALVEDGKAYNVEFKIRNPNLGSIVDIHSEAEYDPEREMVFGVIQDISGQKEAENALKRIEWMLDPQRKPASQAWNAPQPQSYGDLTLLNQNGLILDSVGAEMLKTISGDYLDLLETSSAVYERNGDYAFGIFSSGWCQFMDSSSRNLCGSCGNAAALASGKWLCHESCWKDASLAAMESGTATDIECQGGIHLFAIPIWVNGAVAGAINIGYGDPPRDPEKLQTLAELYQVEPVELVKRAHAYESRPPFIIELAKKRLAESARLIGLMVERSLAEQALRQLNSDLEARVEQRTAALMASNEEMEAFVYSVSHDLRAPLRAVDGYSGLLTESYQQTLDETALRYLSNVRSNVKRMDQLISELLALSRVNRAEMEIQPIAMNRLVEQVFRDHFPADLIGQYSLEVGDLPEICGDAVLLRQVWHNLIDNAIKYSKLREERRIAISGYVEDGQSVYVIRDNGVGFDMAYAQKLFGVFQRLHNLESFEGTGIGLAIVARIIRRHGGRVWAEGVVDGGAAFYFTLPGPE